MFVLINFAEISTISVSFIHILFFFPRGVPAEQWKNVVSSTQVRTSSRSFSRCEEFVSGRRSVSSRQDGQYQVLSTSSFGPDRYSSQEYQSYEHSVKREGWKVWFFGVGAFSCLVTFPQNHWMLKLFLLTNNFSNIHSAVLSFKFRKFLFSLQHCLFTSRHMFGLFYTSSNITWFWNLFFLFVLLYYQHFLHIVFHTFVRLFLQLCLIFQNLCYVLHRSVYKIVI